MLTPQFQLDLADELVIDLFAGGGGASTGMEQALGRHVDIAINHDAAAVSLHQANHPQTRHFVSDVFEVDPLAVTQGRPVGLLWASPDCTFHSKARGGKPHRDRKQANRRRSLAWIVVKWAKLAKPRLIHLENVEEFQHWGPLADDGRPCPQRRGTTFTRWVAQLRNLGYAVEWRELRACDYGAPTIRKRLFLIARCDGQPICWPAPTHAANPTKGSGLKPWKTAAECVDWRLPCPSIFERERPLADATLRRIAHGVMRYVVNSPAPYVVRIGQAGHGDAGKVRPINAPLSTVTTKAEHLLCSPTLVQTGYGEREGQAPRVPGLDKPLGTVVGTTKHGLVAAFLARHYTGVVGASASTPLPTITSIDHHSLVSTRLEPTDGSDRGSADAAQAGRDRGPRGWDHLEAEEPQRYATADATPAGDKKQAGIPCGQGDGRRQELHDGRPSTGLGSAARTDSPGPGHQPPGRQQAQQSAVELGACDAQPEPSARLRDEAALSTEQRAAAHAGGHRAPGKAASLPGHDFPGDRRGPGVLSDHSVQGREAEVAAFLTAYYGSDQDTPLDDPMHTVTTKPRFGLVTVAGERYTIADIGMRMLQPRELYRAQGFLDSYIIDRGHDGRALSKADQVRMCGNSVCPPLARAIVEANMTAAQAVRRAA